MELWLYITIRCQPKWCYPKMVTPGADRRPPLATPLPKLNSKTLILTTNQCRRQSKQSEGAQTKSKGHYNLLIKTDLQILHGYNYAQFENKAGSVSKLVSSATHNRFQNLSAAVIATRRAARILLRGVNQKLFFFCSFFFFARKLHDLALVLNKLIQLKRVTDGHNH